MRFLSCIKAANGRRASRKSFLGRNHALRMEALEQRTLLALLGVVPGYPLTGYDSDGTLTYDAATNRFDIDATPVAIQSTADSVPSFFSFLDERDLQIHIRVDNSGALIGGDGGDDLTLVGTVDLDGDFVPDASGALLTGEILAFGFRDSGGPNDSYDFRFEPTGGALLSYFAGKDIGVTTASENSTFAGLFNVNFHGEAKGNVGPFKDEGGPGGAIDIEKFVKKVCEGEGLTPGFWKQPHHFEYWTNYETGDSYNDVFGVEDPDSPTFLQALERGGGGHEALGRHAVAALLNAAHPNVDYAFTEDQIIDMVQQAWATGDFEAIKDQLVVENERGADLSDASTCLPGDGDDADEPPGPLFQVGDKLMFTYVVTNPGDVPLAVVVTDDNQTPGDPGDDFQPTPELADGYNVGDDDDDNLLDPGEEWRYTWTTTVTAGQHVNVATAVGTPVDAGGNPIGPQVEDEDPAYWYGEIEEMLGLISGFVYLDGDNDGVRDYGEEGIAGVTLELTGTDSSGQPVHRVVSTDSQGYYEFAGLPSGAYTVSEIQPGYLLDGDEKVGSAGGVAVLNDVLAEIKLGPGEQAGD